VKYEAAFRAFQARDYTRAAKLLEPAVQASAYASDILKDTYTWALYHSGETVRLADSSFKIGQELLAHDPASALDYFQRALYAGLDRTRPRQIGEILEGWAVVPVSASRGEAFRGRLRCVAHVVGSLLPGRVSVYVRDFCQSLDESGIEFRVFTTESFSSWLFNSGSSGGYPAMESGAQVSPGSVEGDFLERASRVASKISDAGCDVALFHAGLGEQITAQVAALRPAPLQVNVNHDLEMDANLFDGAVHLFKDACEETRFRERLNHWIPPMSGVNPSGRYSGLRGGAGSPGARRTDLGAFTTVSATFGEGETGADSGYLESLVEILRRSPTHLHLFVGSGNRRRARTYPHARDVLPQVRFLAQPTDSAEYLNLIDLYIGSFPKADVHAILDAMGFGKPVVVRAYPSDSQSYRGAEFVGLDEMIVSTAEDFVGRACHLIEDADYRDALGQAAHLRFRKEFTRDSLGAECLEFLNEFILFVRS
jgi:hypothetical protein